MHWRSVEFAGTVVLVGNSFLGMGMFEEGRGDVLMLMLNAITITPVTFTHQFLSQLPIMRLIGELLH
jgi:hypothetical protein